MAQLVLARQAPVSVLLDKADTDAGALVEEASATSSAFVDPDWAYWRPGVDGWALKAPDGSNYTNPVGSGNARITDGGGSDPAGPHSIVSGSTDGYARYTHGTGIDGAAGQLPDPESDEVYVIWRLRYITNPHNTNTKGLRFYGRGAIGIPQDNTENYEGTFHESGGGSQGFFHNPRNAVSPAQQITTGIWQSAISTNGDNGSLTGYGGNIVDGPWQEWLIHFQTDAGVGGAPRARYWWNGTPVKHGSINATNKSGFFFPPPNGAEWIANPSDADYGTNAPDWLQFAIAYGGSKKNIQSFRYFDTRHLTQVTPGAMDTFGIMWSHSPIDPNFVMFGVSRT